MSLVTALHSAIGRKTLVMGVINTTPDSFFDGGQLEGEDRAFVHGSGLAADGADILDVGGESSRPGADPVTPEEELARVLPVVERLSALNVPVSIDTYRAATAERALEAGAVMVNDISALGADPAMAAVIADAGCDCVLMHMQGTPKTMQKAPRYEDIVDDICAFFEERLKVAVDEGISEEAIWLDPGFGFGKTVEHNLEILRRLGDFKRLGRPLLVGTSNKSTIGAVLDLPVDDRMEGTAATVAASVCFGADAVRVHDVKTMARVAKMCDAILGRQLHD
jgi:dihydropteroate synthase